MKINYLKKMEKLILTYSFINVNLDVYMAKKYKELKTV